jgi:hypothetical protein
MPLRYGTSTYNSNYRSRTALAMFNGFQGVFCNYEYFGSGDFFLNPKFFCDTRGQWF